MYLIGGGWVGWGGGGGRGGEVGEQHNTDVSVHLGGGCRVVVVVVCVWGGGGRGGSIQHPFDLLGDGTFQSQEVLLSPAWGSTRCSMSNH